MPTSVSTTSPSTTAAARGTANVVAALGAGTVGATAGQGGVLTAAAGCAGVAVREASGRGVSWRGALEGTADSEITRVMRAVRRPVSRAAWTFQHRLQGQGYEQEHSDHDAQGSLLARGRDVETWLTG